MSQTLVDELKSLIVNMDRDGFRWIRIGDLRDGKLPEEERDQMVAALLSVAPQDSQP